MFRFFQGESLNGRPLTTRRPCPLPEFCLLQSEYRYFFDILEIAMYMIKMLKFCNLRELNITGNYWLGLLSCGGLFEQLNGEALGKAALVLLPAFFRP